MSDEAWQREIEALHVFFEDWLGAGAGDFAHLQEALAEDFLLVGPDGAAVERPDLVEGIREARGSRPGLEIEIRRPRLRLRSGALTVATYEEWQTDGSGRRGRLSTVVFRDRRAAPNGLEWAHVHESWLPGES